MKKTLLTTSIFALFAGSAMAIDFPINEVNKTVSEGTATQQIISDSSLNISTESNITSNTITTEKDVTDILGGFAVLSESSNINGLNLTNNSILANKDGTYYVQQNNKYYTNQHINGGIFLISGTENITTLNNSKFDNNSITSKSVGGNIDGALIKTDKAELNSENLTLTNNKVVKRVAYTANSVISTVSLNGNSTFKNLIATSNSVEVEKPSGGNIKFDNIFGGILSVNSERTVVSESNLSSNNIIASDSGKINGGIIANSSTLELSNSDLNKNTITANSAPSLFGGIVFNKGNATISNSNFNENIITTKNSFNGGIIASTAGTLQIDNGNFEDNSLTVIDATVSQVAGGIVSVESSTAEINGGKFVNNKINAGYGIDGSVANVKKGASLEISDAEISGNVASVGTYKVRGTVHNYNGKLSINNTTFSGNTIEATAENRALGGALYARSFNASASTTLTGVSFKNNVAKNGMGGAIALEGGSMTINVASDLSASGNYATDKNGIASDARGGFLYLENYDGLYAATAIFNVAENATYTIGNGTANQDSIASGDNTAIINKAGLGSLVVNGSMEYFKGALNVNGGSMVVNSVLGASDIVVASGATLALGDNTNIILYGCSITVEDGATLELGSNSTITVNLEEDFTGSTNLLNIADSATLTQDGESITLAGVEDLITVTYNGQTLDNSQWILDAQTGKLTVVPEPSTYAMIFGAIALGFVAYRRRK